MNSDTPHVENPPDNRSFFADLPDALLFDRCVVPPNLYADTYAGRPAWPRRDRLIEISDQLVLIAIADRMRTPASMFIDRYGITEREWEWCEWRARRIACEIELRRRLQASSQAMRQLWKRYPELYGVRRELAAISDVSDVESELLDDTPERYSALLAEHARMLSITDVEAVSSWKAVCG